jgi:hypothetical protein
MEASMGSRSSKGVAATAIGIVILAAMALGCMPAVSSESGSAAPPGSGPVASPTSSADRGGPSSGGSSAGGPSPTVPGRDAPPDALLAAEGGDPVAGQLGTYVWLETGSDSPWLQGAPLAVGAGEPLTVTLVPDGEILAWTARYVPAGTGGPEGATSLGGGAGTPRFEAPGSGAWTVEVFTEFAPGVGDARYFWRLEVE